MPSPAQILAAIEGASPAVRWQAVGQLGRIRSRDRSGRREYFLDFRPYGRVWSNRGIRITDGDTARRLLEQIRGQVADGSTLEEVITRYLPAKAKPNLVPTWLQKWIDLRQREEAGGSLSPNFIKELRRLAAPGGHFSFFDEISIHEVSYGILEDWSVWLAERKQSPKSRRNYLGYMSAFFRWLERRGEIRKAPKAPSIRVDEHEPKILSIRDQDRVLAAIPEIDRGIFLALSHLGLRPGEARALTVADYHDEWITVDKAIKGKSVSAEVRGTKTGKPKRLPVSEELRDWIEKHVDASGRLRAAPLFPNPRTGRIWPHKALQRVWNAALDEAGLPHVSLYEGTKHTMATDAIRRGVPERHLQRFLGHASIQSTRRYARLADNALIEVLRVPSDEKQTWRQAGDKGSENKLDENQRDSGGPSWVRTRDRPVMSRLL